MIYFIDLICNFEQPILEHMQPKLLYTLIFTLFLCPNLIGQGIQITHSVIGEVSICGPAKFQLELKNNNSFDLSSTLVRFELPAGFSYNLASVSGASEQNISLVNAPVFEIASLAAGSKLVIQLSANTECSLFDAVNNAKTFSNRIVVSSAEAKDSIITMPPYQVNTAYLVIENPSSLRTETGIELRRDVKLINSRLGAVSSVVYRDQHKPAHIRSLNGRTVVQNDTDLVVIYDGSDFAQIGDKDSLLERDEFVIVQELIQSIDCIPSFVNSTLTADWGCNSEYCQQAFQSATVEFINTTNRADLTFEFAPKAPECICDPKGEVQHLKIKNRGKGTAENFCLNLQAYLANVLSQYAILENSITVDPPSALAKIEYKEPNQLCGMDYFRLAELCFNDLSPQEEIDIQFRFLTCQTTIPNDTAAKLNYYYSYQYESKCVNRSLAGKMDVPVVFPYNQPVRLEAIWSSDVSSNKVMNGKDNYNFNLLVETDKKVTTENYEVEFTLPCPLVVETKDFEVAGIKPLAINIDQSYNTRISLLYPPQLPQKFDIPLRLKVDCTNTCISDLNSINSNRVISSCPFPKYEDVQIEIKTCVSVRLTCKDTSLHCGRGAILNEDFTIVCDPDTLSKDTVLTYAILESESYRSSYGKIDSLDMRINGGRTALRNEVDETLLLMGDTLMNRISAVIFSDNKNVQVSNVEVLIITDMTFKPAVADLQIHSRKFGTFKGRINPVTPFSGSPSPLPNCYKPVVTKSGYGVGYIVRLDPDTLQKFGLQLPPDFYFESGDSIQVDFEGRLISLPGPRVVSTEITNYVLAYESDSLFTPISCGKSSRKFKIAMNGLTFLESGFDLITCGSQADFPSYRITAAPYLNNFFRKEFRQFHHLDSIAMQLPDGVSVDSFRLEYFYLNQALKDSLIYSFSLPVSYVNNFAIGRLNNFQKQIAEENYMIQITPKGRVEDCVKLKNGTQNSASMLLYGSSTDDYPFYLGTQYFVPLQKFTFSKNIPLKKLNNANTLSADEKSIQTNLAETKIPIRIPSSDLPGAYLICVHSVHGTVDSFSIVSNEGIQIAETNKNCFVIQGFQLDSAYLVQLVTGNATCKEDTILLSIFWSCHPEQLMFSDSCNFQEIKIPIRPLMPELEMDVMQKNAISSLCDTLPEVMLELYNGDQGVAFDLALELVIPDGIHLIPNTLQYSYPIGSSYRTMPLPTQVRPNLYRWQFSDIIPEIKANGLLGLDQFPKNSIRLRMYAETDCDANVNGYLQFIFSGKDPCQQQNNTITKSGSQIRIQGVQNANNHTIKSSSVQVDCQDETKIEFSVESTADFNSGDSLLITLPEYIDFVQGSLISLQGLNVSGVRYIPGMGKHLLIIPFIPNSVKKATGSFLVNHLSSLPCGESQIGMRSFSRQKALCVRDNKECEVLLISGETNIILSKKLAEVQIDSIDFSGLCPVGQKGIKLYVDVKNGLLLANEKFTLQLFEDIDGNRKLNQNDRFVQLLTPAVQSFPQDGKYEFVICVPESNLTKCNYVISTRQNCICNADTLAISLGGQEVFEKDTICEGATLTLGVSPSASTSYQWSGPGINCDTCSLINWTGPRINGDTLVELTLTEFIGGSCALKHIYQILNVKHPFSRKEIYKICPGESVMFNAGSHTKYRWRQDPDLKQGSYSQNVVVDTSKTYYLDFEDAVSCTGTDTFCVISYDKPNGLTITNDTTILFGTEVILEVMGGIVEKWSPNYELSCIECNKVVASPKFNTLYQAQVRDSNNCLHTLNVAIMVVRPECDTLSLFVPNAFSPNGDTHNDKFYVRGQNFEKISLVVYNRWGQKVFETQDPQFGWDGTYKGEPLGPDVFGYCVEAYCFGGLKIVRRGNVTLLK